MASVTGSRLAFFAAGVDPSNINTVLTTDGTGIAAPVAGKFNIEVFTSTPGALATGYDASAFVQGAQSLSNNVVQGGTIGSTEQLLAGNYAVIDQTGHETILIGGSDSSGSSITVIGSAGDTIEGNVGPGAVSSQLIDASGTNPEIVAGPMTIVAGAGPTTSTTVWAGASDSIVGGTGALTVAGNAGNNQTIAGGTGNLTAFNFGTKASVTGSAGGTTFIDDAYPGGGGATLVGGSGLATLAGGGGVNTWIVAGKGDKVTGGSALTYINAEAGSVTVQGGNSTVTGTLEGANNVNTNILGGVGDSITGGAGATYIDASAGIQTVTGGGGATRVFGGNLDQITGGAGDLQVNAINPNAANLEKITGGSGNLFVFNIGKGNTIGGSSSGTTFVDDSYSVSGAAVGGSSTITGGNGTVTGAGGRAVNTFVIGAAGDVISGGTGTMSVAGGAGSDAIIGGSGATTVEGRNLDTITGNSGTLLVDITATSSGTETVNLSAGHGAATLRDVNPGATTTGATDVTTVTGFSTATDTIASRTSVDPTNAFIGSSTTDAQSNTVLTFLDGTTMTLVGVSNVLQVKFTQ